MTVIEKPISFQKMIQDLTEFWRERGSLVWHPHNVQVGAGTNNPATILKVLGPEPWNVVYLEPSIRPDDGRFGENPNRMQQHFQMQVILKPDPGNPTELYLQSLEAIGINLLEHDVRFVEDNWESPALAAWGLGWEVWLDGQEISQFTYFQQAGGVSLDPVSVEITYGLDRMAIALQNVESVWDLEYGAGLDYGAVLLQSEIEHCRYYFDVADVESIRKVYDAYEQEANRCLEHELVAPALDYVLKSSHLFNILDTRGAVGVTERAGFFRRMRRLSRAVAQAYLTQRQKAGFPLLPAVKASEPEQKPTAKRQFPQPTGGVETFVLEIGTEELPAAEVTSARRQLASGMESLLKELRLDYGAIESFATPRRLALIITGLKDGQPDRVVEAKGPPADRAFDSEGNPTKAAIGFARSKGIEPADLKTVELGGKKYVSATVSQVGKSTFELLSEALPRQISNITFGRGMRWNASNVAFGRPIRWLLAIYGTEVVPFEFAGLTSDRFSRGIRPDGSPECPVRTAAEYRPALEARKVVLDEAARQLIIDDEATRLAREVGGQVLSDATLTAEIANLVEAPAVFRGTFEERFLELPAEVLVAVMKKHQRYIPVYASDGVQLLPYFIAVRNGGTEQIDKVVSGNEHVIRARFADADFFFERDGTRALADFVPDLAGLTFQQELGSMLDKVHRLESLVPTVAEQLGLNTQVAAIASRAASLSKADLVTNMVVEMTSLQGVMGRIYALRSGESAEVAAAIGEQYQAVSHTSAGMTLALADRIDSLVALFAAGLAPKGSRDPFALRRSAIQIIENLISNGRSFDLRQALRHAATLQPLDVGDDTQAAIQQFLSDRLENYLVERGSKVSVVRAVIAEQWHDPFAASVAARQLEEASGAGDWTLVLDAFARCARISKESQSGKSTSLEPIVGTVDVTLDPVTLFATATVSDSMLQLEEEKALWTAIKNVREEVGQTVEGLVNAIRVLEPAISRFFDNVLVMDEDPAIRSNRLALVGEIAGLASGIAELSHLEGF